MIDRLRRTLRMARWLLTITGQTLLLSITARFVPAERRKAHRAIVQQRRIRVLLSILRVNVRVAGRFPDEPHLIASNHLGIVDPWVLGAQLPAAFAAKAEMRGWPLAGWICRTVGIIFVDRRRRMRTTEFSQEIRDRMDQGISVIVFPEGTTTNGSKVLPFKTGAFDAVAGHADRAVLPVCLNIVAINGEPVDAAGAEFLTWADDRQPLLEHAWDVMGIRSADVELAIGTPIAAGRLDRKQLAEQARAQVVAMNRWVDTIEADAATASEPPSAAPPSGDALPDDNSARISVDSSSPNREGHRG